MSAAFDAALAFILRPDIEGGYIDDPQDPGGRTKFGISQRAFPSTDIASLTPAKAKALYRRHYWLPARCDLLPDRIAIAVFDCAVNQGVRTSARLLQTAVRVRRDGQIGPRTLAAIARSDPDTLLLDFLSHRLRRYARTRNADRFFRGWARRVLALLQTLKATP